MSTKFYITTPIYYVNDKPHIGHAYTTIVADTLARYHRLKGEEVFFLTGADENSQNNVKAAATAGENDIQAYLDRMSALWRMTWGALELTNTDFIRTTEARHAHAVEEFYRRVQSAGDIYTSDYEGLYCQSCEAFVTEKELVDGNCPLHLRPPVLIKETNYFFRASRYRDQILAHIQEHPEFIAPESRRNEVLAYVKEHFGDVSISRQWKTDKNVGGVTIGIPVPGDPTQALYVWFDALLNYITGVGFASDETQFNTWWPADLHIVGKDIIKFHCALWPAMLLSAGLALPKKVFAHGFFTVNGQKMSKTIGNVVNPLDVAERFGIDPLRYFVLREIPFGGDGDFSLDRLAERYVSDLSNGIGNLTRRITTLAGAVSPELKECQKMIAGNDAVNRDIAATVDMTWKRWIEAMDAVEPHKALDALWELFGTMDGYLETKKPWMLTKSEPHTAALVLWPLLEALRHIGWMLWPAMPKTAVSIWEALGVRSEEEHRKMVDAKRWGALYQLSLDITKGEPLFPRLGE